MRYDPIPVSSLLALAVLSLLALYDAKRGRIHLVVLSAGAVGELALLAVAAPGELPARLAAALGCFALFALVGLSVRGGMGSGDPLLAAYVGLVVGGVYALGALLVASCAGIVFALAKGASARKVKLPFAPFVAASTIAALFFRLVFGLS